MSTDNGYRVGSMLKRDARASERPRTRCVHPGLLGRRHARGGVLLRRARGTAAHRVVTAEGQPARACSTRSTSSPACPAAASPRWPTALYGDKLFDEYEQRFLKRNVQGDAHLARAESASTGARCGRRAGAAPSWRPSYTTRSCSTARRSRDLDREHGPADHGVTRTDISTGARLAVHAGPLRPPVLRPGHGAAVARRRGLVGGARGAVAGHAQQLRRHLRRRHAALGEGRHQAE